MHLRQIVYGNTMLQFDENANVDASVNQALLQRYSLSPQIVIKTLFAVLSGSLLFSQVIYTLQAKEIYL